MANIAFMVGAIILRPKKRRVVLERSWVPDSRLIFESVEDFVDQELQQSEAFHRLVASERAQGEDRERFLLVRRLPPMSALSVAGSFVRRLRLPSTIAQFHGVARGSFHVSSSWM